MDIKTEYEDADKSKGYRCFFCREDSRKGHDDIKHTLECPVAVAKNVLN